MFITVTQDIKDFKLSKPMPYAFRDWIYRLNKGEKLPRGKYFSGKKAGKPMVIIDEFWNGTSHIDFSAWRR